MDNTRKSFLILSTFSLQIIGLICLTFEHLSWMLSDVLGYNYWLVILFQILGASALPVLMFVAVETISNSKKVWLYFLLIGIAASLLAGTSALIQYLPIFEGFSIRLQGNVFVDILLGASAFYFLSKDKWYLKILAVLPLSIGIAAFFVVGYEYQNIALTHWFPYFIRPHYHFYGALMGILFYVANVFRDMFLKQYSNNSGIPVESLLGTRIDRTALNLFRYGMILFETVLMIVISLSISSDWIFWNISIVNAALISGAFILLYNGLPGYNAKWFQYTRFGYYGLHLLAIFGIGILIMMI